MDDKLLKDILHDLAQQEIPDDMKLWTRIEPALPVTPSRRVRGVTRLAWIAAALLISLMVGAGTYAFYQSRQNSDPGLKQIQDKNLVTPIGESRTIDGVTVTLDWAYADAHRIALAFTTTSEQDPDNPLAYNPDITKLQDDQGREFRPMFGGGGGDPGLQSANANFDAVTITGAPDALTLTFQVYLIPAPVTAPLAPDVTPDSSGGGGWGGGSGGGGGAGGGGGSGGGGGGGGGGDASASDTPAYPAMEDAIGPYTFTFSVPFIPAVVIEPAQTVEANDVPLTLVRASITPSLTRLTLCRPAQADAGAMMQPNGVLIAGGDEVPRQGAELGPQVAVQPDDTICHLMSFLAAYDREPATWTLRIERLEGIANPSTDELAEALAAYGIEIAVYPEEQRWETTVVPDGLDIGQVMQEVYASFTPQIAGPWVFTLDIPGAD